MNNNSSNEKICLMIILGMLCLLFIILCMNKNIEDFGNYKSSCKGLPKAVKYALEKRNLKKVDDNTWDYYLPCGYTKCEKNVREFKNEKTGKMIFMIDGCDWIASKVSLWNVIKENFGRFSSEIMPQTFVLSSDKDIEEFKKFYKKKKSENKNCKFILKNYKQRQEGLKLENNLSNILNSVKDGFKLVQDFLENPYLISGRKVNLRYYLLISCKDDKLKGWVYKDGFVYYTPKPFKKNSMDFKETITTGYIDRKIYETNPLTVEDFRKHLGTEKAKKYDEEVNTKLKSIMISLKNRICIEKDLKHHLKFQYFGADIAPDENLNCTIMEINKGPDIGFKDERDGNVKKNMIHDIFKVIDPKDEEDKKHGFTRIF